MNKILPVIVIGFIIVGGIFLFKRTNLNKSGSLNQTGNTAVEVNPTQSTASGIVANPQEIPLTISTLQNGQTVTTPNLTVSGKTVPNADMSINDIDLKADAAGNFSHEVSLDEGENIISISAYNNEGNYAEEEISVILATEQ